MNELLHDYLQPAALALLGVAGTYLMFRLLFLPVRSLGEAARLVRAPSTDERLPRPLDALSLTAGATAAGALGGTATAILLGGPGAVVWVMLGGFLSMSMRYVEASHAWQTRAGDGDQLAAGLAPVFRNLFGRTGRVLALAYAVLALVAALTALGLVPLRLLADDLERTLRLPALAGSGLIAAGALLLTWRSPRLAGLVARRITPIVLGLLTLLLVATCVRHGSRVPGAIGRMLGQALGGGVASAGFLGAFLGETIRSGAARGLVTGSSLGIAASIHGSSGASSAHRAGLVAMLEPLLAAVILPCLIGAAVLSSRSWNSPHDARIPLSELRAYTTEPASAAELAGTELALDGIIRVREGQSFDRFTLATSTSLVNEPRFEYRGAPWDGAIRFAKGRVVGLLELKGVRKALDNVDPSKADRILVNGEGPLFGAELVGTAFETLLPFRWGRWVAGLASLALGLVAAMALLLFTDSQARSTAGRAAAMGGRVLVAAALGLGPLVPGPIVRLLPWALVPLTLLYAIGLCGHASRAESLPDEDAPARAPSSAGRPPRKRR